MRSWTLWFNKLLFSRDLIIGSGFSSSYIITSGHSAKVRRLCSDNARMALTAIATIINPMISKGAGRMEWNGALDPGDVRVISKDGMVSINGSRVGNISGTVPEADAGGEYVRLQ